MKQDINRRDFLKTAGSAALAMGGLGTIAGCASNSGKTASAAAASKEPGEMTYRTNKGNGDKVSILGYGCMRWPMIKDENGRDVIDQETVDRLIDYAIEHGVNYFDTAPVYLQGQSESATGKSLKRYPRESYFIATKLSNFSNSSKENSIEMYRSSLKNLQTDYIDYYLLHSLSGGDAFNERFGKTGIMDFLQEERKAGRIRNLGFSFHGTAEGFDEMMALHDTYHWDFVQIQLVGVLVDNSRHQEQDQFKQGMVHHVQEGTPDSQGIILLGQQHQHTHAHQNETDLGNGGTGQSPLEVHGE